MSVPRLRRLAPAACIAALALGGCGGGNDAAAPAQITKALQAGLTSNDAVVLCEQALSTGLVTRVYGGKDRCLQIERRAAASRAAAGSAQVSRIAVDGDHGTAYVVLRGGDQDGARGALSVVRQDGAWRLDDLSTAFLRSEFTAGLGSGAELQANLTDCVGKRVVALSDAALRTLAFGAMGGRPQAQAQLRDLVTACIRSLSAPSSGQVS
jgi:hypothetical protein